MADSRNVNDNLSTVLKQIAKTNKEDTKTPDWNRLLEKGFESVVEAIKKDKNDTSSILQEYLEKSEEALKAKRENSYGSEIEALKIALEQATLKGNEKDVSYYKDLINDSEANKLLEEMNDLLDKQDKKSETNKKLKTGQEKLQAQYNENKLNASFLDRLNPDSEYNQKQKEILEKQAELYNAEHGTNKTAEDMEKINEQKKLRQAVEKVTSSLLTIADKLGEYKQSWDTRLQGANIDYDSLAKTISNSIGVSPFIKQSTVYEKLNSAISEGIAFNVEQRAFLDVLSEGIATTFNAFDETLKDLVRVQQADSTAYRLGMEASLTKYLNSMYETTEYLNNVSDGVTSSLYEASSLLSAEESIGTEYQIQKWLGSLYSVGMSSSTVENISSALGKLLSGDVSVMETGGGKLLTMAASNAGIDLGTALTEGLNASEINSLLNSVVSYLQSLESSGKNNNVVLNQLSSLFDMKVSDLKAASNLTGYNSSIYNNNSSYNAYSALESLQTSINSYSSRMNLATWIGNLKENLNYTLSGNISSSPALYALVYASDLLNDYVGGGNIPTLTTMFGGIDLETNLANLLSYASLGGTLLASMGGIVNGLAQIGGGGVNVLANAFGIDTSKADSIKTLLVQGKSEGYKEGDTSYVSYSYKGTSAGDDYTDKTSQIVSDTKTQEGAKIEEDDSKDLEDIYDQHNTIIEILNDLVEGNKSILVRNNTSVDSSNILWDSMSYIMK